MIVQYRFKTGRPGSWILHFSPRSRDQPKAHVLTYHQRLPSRRHRLPPLYRMLHRQSPPRAAAWNMKSFLYCQSEVGFGTTGSCPRIMMYSSIIPLEERKIPDHPACAHTRYGNGNPEATLCETTETRIIRGIQNN